MLISPVGSTRSTNAPMVTSLALELMKISRSSGEDFAVEPFPLPSLENRFRIAHATLSDMPTAFMGAAGAAFLHVITKWKLSPNITLI